MAPNGVCRQRPSIPVHFLFSLTCQHHILNLLSSTYARLERDDALQASVNFGGRSSLLSPQAIAWSQYPVQSARDPANVRFTIDKKVGYSSGMFFVPRLRLGSLSNGPCPDTEPSIPSTIYLMPPL